MRDLYSNISIARALDPNSFTSSAAQTGQIVDRQGFESVTYALALGTLGSTGVSFTVGLEESATTASTAFSSVGSSAILESTAGSNFNSTAGDNSVIKFGYLGHERYTRLKITPSGASTAASVVGAMAILGHAWNRPTT